MKLAKSLDVTVCRPAFYTRDVIGSWGTIALFGRASDHLPLSLSSLTAEVESVRAVSVSQNGGQLYSTRLHVSFWFDNFKKRTLLPIFITLPF